MYCCIHCFDNIHIQAVIHNEDEQGQCSYCDMNGEDEVPVAGVDVVGEVVREALSKAYKNATTDDVPYRALESISTTIEDVLIHTEEIFSEELDNSGNISLLIQDLFQYSGPSEYEQMHDGEMDEWEGGDVSIVMIDEFYASKDDNHFRYQWDEFTYVVKHVNRFFDMGGSRESMLGDFDGFFEVMARQLPVGTRIWRARSKPDLPIATIEARTKESGPPPRDRARPLRMNPAGISYFYGSEDKKTCKLEIRPGEDDHILYGKFETLRDLQVVDLSVAPRIHVKSIFDPDYDHSMEWATLFLEGFIEEISRPIDEKAAPIEYVPTQILSEYIRKLGYDGVLFRSSITQEINYLLFCGREETQSEPARLWRPRWNHPNQVPDFRQWLKLIDFDQENAL